MPFKNRIFTTLVVVAALAAALGLIDNASAASKKSLRMSRRTRNASPTWTRQAFLAQGLMRICATPAVRAA